MKRFITVLMSAMIALSMMPTMAFADVEAGVATADELVDAIQAGGDINLSDDINLTSQLIIDKSVTIHGNGHTITSDIEQNTAGTSAAGILITNGAVLENVKVIGPNKSEGTTWKSGFITVKAYGGNSTLRNVEFSRGSEALQVSGEGTKVTLEGTQNYHGNTYNGIEVKASATLDIANGTKFTDENTSVIWIDAEGTGTISGVENAGLKSIETGSSKVQYGYPIADINRNKYYDTLENALNASADGDVVNLIKDYTATKNPWINHDITVDLNNNTLTAGWQCAICTKETVQNAIVQNGTLKDGSFSTVYNLGNTTLANCKVLAQKDGGGVFDYGTNSAVTIRNCYIDGNNYWAIYHNGSTGGFRVDVYDSELRSEAQGVYISGSVNTSSEAGRNQIANFTNCKIEGSSGIEGKFTDIKTKDCDVTSTVSTPVFEQNNNGSTADGFAIVSTDNTMEPNSPAPSATIEIDGGNYIGLVGLCQLIDKDQYPDFKEATYSIKSGTFSSSPKAYVATGTNIYHQKTGNYFVGSMPASTSGYNAWALQDGIYEETYVAPAEPETPDAPVIDNSGSGDNASTNVDASGSTVVTDGKAETSIDLTTGKEIVDKAVENKSTEVVIKAETEKGEATGSTVALPESTVQALAADDVQASVTIKTDNATVTLDKDAVKATAEQAGTDGEVKLVVETIENTADTLKVELKLVTSKGTVTDFRGGNVTVTVPVNEELAGKKIVCVYIDENGKYTKMEGELSKDGKSYIFKTGHFSTYAILEEAEADAIIAKQNIKVGTASVKLYTAKGGKLRVKASAKNATGYRVYYKKSSWKNYKTYTKGKIKTLDKTFKKLSKGKYTVQVRAYYKDYEGTKSVTWGAKSKAKTITVKK